MARLSLPVGPIDHVRGAAAAEVTLIQYGDYQCPYCADAHAMLRSVLRVMSADLRYVFRHMPMNELHPFALFAAEAAEAAAAQGKFWEMHDVLYENQADLGSDLVHTLAERLELDLPRFAADLDARRFRNRVKYDFLGAMRNGVIATPTFFLNDQRYAGAVDERALLLAIREKINS